MSQTTKIYLILTCVGILVAIMWTPLRTALGGLISVFLTPAFLGTLRATFLWTFWTMKKVLEAHSIVLKNLVRPRSVIYPSLQDDDERKL